MTTPPSSLMPDHRPGMWLINIKTLLGAITLPRLYGGECEKPRVNLQPKFMYSVLTRPTDYSPNNIPSNIILKICITQNSYKIFRFVNNSDSLYMCVFSLTVQFEHNCSRFNYDQEKFSDDGDRPLIPNVLRRSLTSQTVDYHKSFYLKETLPSFHRSSTYHYKSWSMISPIVSSYNLSNNCLF